jgi:hypothetical protein
MIYGVPGVGNVAGAALGAAAGNSVGQLLATGDVDWDQVIKTAATAAVGAYGTTGYAATVGKAVGVTNAAAAQVVGNAIINSSLSGIEAALTGGNVEKSMLAGAVKGAALVSATNVAEAFLGKDGLASLSKLTTLTADQVANVFTSSLVNGITAEINNTGEFADVFGKSIVSSGIGEKAATEMDNAVKTKLKDNPEIRASVFNATKNITSVGTNAALSGRDVKDAIDKASAGIIISSGQAYRNELDRQEELAEARKKQLGATQQPVMVAGPPSAETLAQIQSQPTVSERLVFSDFVDTEDGGFQQTRVQGTRNDGSIYEYDIFTYEDGKVFYAAYNSDLQSEYFDTRPNLTNRNDLGLTSEEVASRDYTAGIDLRDTSGTGGAGRAVIGGGGAGGGGNAVGFNFIGVDSDGRERYDIDGNSFTLFVVNNQKILRNDKTFVELIPIVRPPNPNDPDPTPVVDLKENPEPKIPPKPEPPPPPEPPPVPLKPGEEAKGTEGVTGKEGEKGVAGGAPSQTPPQFTPEPTPSPAPRPTPAPAPNPRQAEIDAAAKEAEEERVKQEIARQQAEKAAQEQQRLDLERQQAEAEATAAKNAAEKKAAEERARKAAEEQARQAEQERLAREREAAAKAAAEKFERDVETARGAFETIIATTGQPTDFTVPEPVPSLDEGAFRYGDEDFSQFTEAKQAFDAVAGNLQNEIDRLNTLKSEATATFNGFDPAVQERLRAEFNAEVADLDDQIGTLTGQRDEATARSNTTGQQLADAERFVAQIRQERINKIAQAKLLRADEDRRRFEDEQQRFNNEVDRLEAAIARAEQEEQSSQSRQVDAFQKRKRLQGEGLLTGDVSSLLEAELDDLVRNQMRAEREQERSEAQRLGLVAPQQPGDPTRDISDTDILRLLGLGPGEGERFGFEGDTDGPSAGEGPGASDVGEAGGAGDEGEGPGAGEFGVGPGAGEEGLGPGGGGTGGEGSGEVTTRLSPSLIFDRETGGRPETTPFASRVTGEALASILGEKEPLFGGDDDEQRAVWNRRSLKLLSRALGL